MVAMDNTDKQLKMIGLGDIFEKLTDRSAQRLTVIKWIHDKIDESVQQYGGVGVTPVVPRGSPGFVILTFLSTNDVRHFEGIVSKKRRNKEIPDAVKTQR